MYTGINVKYRSFLSYLNKAWIVSKDFRKILQVWCKYFSQYPVFTHIQLLNWRRHKQTTRVQVFSAT